MRQDMPWRCVVPLLHARDVRPGHCDPHVRMLRQQHRRVLGWDRLHDVRHGLRRLELRTTMSSGSAHRNHLLGSGSVHGGGVGRCVHMQLRIHLRGNVQSLRGLVRRVPFWNVRHQLCADVPRLPEHLQPPRHMQPGRSGERSVRLRDGLRDERLQCHVRWRRCDPHAPSTVRAPSPPVRAHVAPDTLGHPAASSAQDNPAATRALATERARMARPAAACAPADMGTGGRCALASAPAVPRYRAAFTEPATRHMGTVHATALV